MVSLKPLKYDGTESEELRELRLGWIADHGTEPVQKLHAPVKATTNERYKKATCGKELEILAESVLITKDGVLFSYDGGKKTINLYWLNVDTLEDEGLKYWLGFLDIEALSEKPGYVKVFNRVKRGLDEMFAKPARRHSEV